MERSVLVSLFASRIERRVRSFDKDVLPIYNNADFIKCKDYDVDKVNLAQLQKTNLVKKKIGLIAPSFKEEDEQFCDMV